MAGVSAKRIAAGVVVDLIAAEERVDGQQGSGAEGVLIAGSDVEGENFLPLVLLGLVVGVGHLEPIARGQQIEVEGIAGGGLVIEAVEDGLAVADVVNRPELGRVQKAPGAQASWQTGNCRTCLPPRPRVASSPIGAEGAVLRGEAAGRLLAESGSW